VLTARRELAAQKLAKRNPAKNGLAGLRDVRLVWRLDCFVRGRSVSINIVRNFKSTRLSIPCRQRTANQLKSLNALMVKGWLVASFRLVIISVRYKEILGGKFRHF
jgi:hypothetical protein